MRMIMKSRLRCMNTAGWTREIIVCINGWHAFTCFASVSYVRMLFATTFRLYHIRLGGNEIDSGYGKAPLQVYLVASSRSESNRPKTDLEHMTGDKKWPNWDLGGYSNLDERWVPYRTSAAMTTVRVEWMAFQILEPNMCLICTEALYALHLLAIESDGRDDRKLRILDRSPNNWNFAAANVSKRGFSLGIVSLLEMRQTRLLWARSEACE